MLVVISTKVVPETSTNGGFFTLSGTWVSTLRFTLYYYRKNLSYDPFEEWTNRGRSLSGATTNIVLGL